MKKILVLFLCAILSLGVMAGCVGDAAPTIEATAAPTDLQAPIDNGVLKVLIYEKGPSGYANVANE